GVSFAKFREQELVMSRPERTVHATARRWHELRVALVERREFQDEQYVRLNPELKIAHRKQDTFWRLSARAPILFEASGKRVFLLVELEFRQQERMTDANVLAAEGIDHHRRKLSQLQTGR